MNFAFHPDALAEFENTASYYAQKEAGLGQHFVLSVETAIHKLAAHPSNYAILEGDVRRCLTRIFPYAVLYTIETDFILIVAVMHCHQKPGYWQHRMSSPR